MKTSELESAYEEMEYTVSENSFGMEMPASIPAQFACDPEATLDADALEDRLEAKDLGVYIEFDRARSLDFEVYGRDYKRIGVKMNSRSVRVYPRENEPTLGELAQITSAIEQAMDCSLSHDPIESD